MPFGAQGLFISSLALKKIGALATRLPFFWSRNVIGNDARLLLYPKKAKLVNNTSFVGHIQREP